MAKSELKTTLEKEVMAEPNNPYRPYRVEFPYEVSFTTPQDDYNTQITITTRSEEIRFGKDEHDVMLQKGVDNQYGRLSYWFSQPGISNCYDALLRKHNVPKRLAELIEVGRDYTQDA